MREVTIPATHVVEDIQAIAEMTNTHVIVYVGVRDPITSDWVVPQTFKDYVIDKDKYAELVSANPTWAPNKPAGTYRNEDLWRFIDIIRSEPVNEPVRFL